MKRLLTALAAGALFASCDVSADRSLPKFGAADQIATTNGPITFTVAPNGRIYFAELRTNTIAYLDKNNVRHEIVTPADKPDSLAVDGRGVVYVAARNQVHRLSITRYDAGEPTVIWRSGTSRFAAHIAIGNDGGLFVGWNTRLFRLDANGAANQKEQPISDDYTDPVFAFGRGKRIWVADNALPGSKERVVRGRERNVAKRNRFGTVVPAYTNPSSAVVYRDEVLLCSRTHRKVYRLHIGLDDVARRREWLKGLVCERDIALRSDGSLVSASRGVIYRYPPA